MSEHEARLQELAEIWKRYPDLRLPQLIGNVYHIPSGADPYYLEDDEFVAELEKFYTPKKGE